VITTIAGTGAAGSSGNGGPSDQALLNGPIGNALDSKGTLYVVDSGNKEVRKIDEAGKPGVAAGKRCRGRK
jgi:DNA-binding beta-propeller fold protein YncE